MTTPTEPAAWRALAEAYVERRSWIMLHDAIAQRAPSALRRTMRRRFTAHICTNARSNANTIESTNKSRSLFCLLMAHEAEEEGAV